MIWYSYLGTYKYQGLPRDNSRGKFPGGFHGKCFFFPFQCKYRSRDPIQTVPEEILISRSHPNSSRGNVWFPVFFRSCAVKSPGILHFPNPAQTKIVEKNTSRGNYSRAFSVHGNTNGINAKYIRVLVPTRYVWYGMIYSRWNTRIHLFILYVQQFEVWDNIKLYSGVICNF